MGRILCFIFLAFVSANAAPPLPSSFDDEAVEKMNIHMAESMKSVEDDLNKRAPHEIDNVMLPAIIIQDGEIDLSVQYNKTKMRVDGFEIFSNVTIKNPQTLQLISDLMKKNVSFSGTLNIEGSINGKPVKQFRHFEMQWIDLVGRVSLDLSVNGLMMFFSDVKISNRNNPSKAVIEGNDIDGITKEMLVNEINKSVASVLEKDLDDFKNEAASKMSKVIKKIYK